MTNVIVLNSTTRKHNQNITKATIILLKTENINEIFSTRTKATFKVTLLLTSGAYQPPFACSKSTIKIREKFVKSVPIVTFIRNFHFIIKPRFWKDQGMLDQTIL